MSKDLNTENTIEKRGEVRRDFLIYTRWSGDYLNKAREIVELNEEYFEDLPHELCVSCCNEYERTLRHMVNGFIELIGILSASRSFKISSELSNLIASHGETDQEIIIARSEE